jgi:hypothetical protein
VDAYKFNCDGPSSSLEAFKLLQLLQAPRS